MIILLLNFMHFGKLCAKLNFTRVIFEGDALAIVKVVNNIETNWE